MKNEFGFLENHWKVYIRDKCKCGYCGLDGMTFANWRQLRIDHIIPKSCRGDESLENLATSCLRCNENKGQFDPRIGIDKSQTITRALLIENARTFINKKIVEERKAFDAMMREINSK